MGYYDGIDPISAVQAWWQATPAVSSLFGDPKLWHRERAEGESYPYATVFLVADAPEIWTTAYPFRRSSVQLNVHAATDEQALRLALAIRQALATPPFGTLAQSLSINGQAVAHVLPDGDGIDVGEGLGPDGRDCWIAFETFDLMWTT